MFDVNGTILIFVVSFLVFQMLLDKFFLKPVERVLTLRAAKVKSDIEDGKSARAQAEEVLDGYHQQLQKTKHEAQAIINEALEKAAYHRNLEMTRLKEDGNKRLEAARAELAVERSSLIEALVRQEEELVSSIVEKLTGERAEITLDPIVVRRTLEAEC